MNNLHISDLMRQISWCYISLEVIKKKKHIMYELTLVILFVQSINLVSA